VGDFRIAFQLLILCYLPGCPSYVSASSAEQASLALSDAAPPEYPSNGRSLLLPRSPSAMANSMNQSCPQLKHLLPSYIVHIPVWWLDYKQCTGNSLITEGKHKVKQAQREKNDSANISKSHHALLLATLQPLCQTSFHSIKLLLHSIYTQRQAFLFLWNSTHPVAQSQTCETPPTLCPSH